MLLHRFSFISTNINAKIILYNNGVFIFINNSWTIFSACHRQCMRVPKSSFLSPNVATLLFLKMCMVTSHCILIYLFFSSEGYTCLFHIFICQSGFFFFLGKHLINFANFLEGLFNSSWLGSENSLPIILKNILFTCFTQITIFSLVFH